MLLNQQAINRFLHDMARDVEEEVRPKARKDAFNEAIAHFVERAKDCPDQTIRHEAVVAVLSALRDNYWGGEIGFYKLLCNGTGVEIVAKITTPSGEVKELLLDPRPEVLRSESDPESPEEGPAQSSGDTPEDADS